MSLHQVQGARLWVPDPALAWVTLLVGSGLIIIGALCALKVRRSRLESGIDGIQPFIGWGRENLSYLIHDYDGSDKFLLLLGMGGRMVGVLAILWAAAGFFIA